MNICSQDIKAEITVAKNCFNKPNGDLTIEDLRSTITEQVFPNLYKMLQVALTLPISSATCELSFSAIKRINTWVNTSTSMLQDRFAKQSILHIEKDLTKIIDNVNILDKFLKSSNTLILK